MNCTIASSGCASTVSLIHAGQTLQSGVVMVLAKKQKQKQTTNWLQETPQRISRWERSDCHGAPAGQGRKGATSPGEPQTGAGARATWPPGTQPAPWLFIPKELQPSVLPGNFPVPSMLTKNRQPQITRHLRKSSNMKW